MASLNGVARRAVIALGAITMLSAPGLTSKPLSALSKLEPGMWQLRDLDNARTPTQSICVADPGVLMQVQHRASPCSRTIIASDDRAATVHYTCPANGFGRTSLTVETPRLAKIDTQGIFGNAPFGLRAEARRVGNCGGGGAKLRH